MVVVDGTPIRKKAQRAYQKTVRDLAAAQAELNDFHERDQPAYSRWINRNFGALLTEIRELQSKLFEAQQLAAEVEHEYLLGGHHSITSAYREVMRRRAQPEPEPPEESFDKDPAEDGFRQEYEETSGGGAEDYWERVGQNTHGRTHSDAREKKAAPTPSQRLKELYRALARRLHPDKSREFTPSEKEWWHQTQAAYESGNVEQMEMILTLVEIQDKGTRETSISALAKLTDAFRKTLRALKRQLSQLRREAAWNFSERTDLSLLFSEIESSLRADREKIASVLAHYEIQITKWERAAAAGKRSRPGGRVPVGQDEFWS